MHWIVVDLDCTLVDTKALVDSGGPEPQPGTLEHQQWVRIVTEPTQLLKAPAVDTVLNLVRQLEHCMLNTMVVFITNRRQQIRDITETWLSKYDLRNPLFVRPDTENTRAGEFKENVIQQMIQDGDSVLVIDDDPDYSIEKMCTRNGWTHLKCTTYGRQLPKPSQSDDGRTR